MKSFIRMAGYLGLVFLLGGVTSLAILPGGGRGRSSTLRDDLAWAAVIGYVLVAARLGHLTLQGGDRRTRLLSGLGVLVMAIGAVGGYLGIALVMTNQASPG